MNINDAINKEYQKYQGKAGRPKGRNEKEKKYGRLSISITEMQRKEIQKYADKNHDGNISTTIREVLKKNKIIKE